MRVVFISWLIVSLSSVGPDLIVVVVGGYGVVLDESSHPESEELLLLSVLIALSVEDRSPSELGDSGLTSCCTSSVDIISHVSFSGCFPRRDRRFFLVTICHLSFPSFEVPSELLDDGADTLSCVILWIRDQFLS